MKTSATLSPSIFLLYSQFNSNSNSNSNSNWCSSLNNVAIRPIRICKSSKTRRSRKATSLSTVVLRCCSSLPKQEQQPEQEQEAEASVTIQGGDHDHVLQTFLKERYLDADFVSKASDLLWLNNYLQLIIIPSAPQTPLPPPQQLHQVMDNDNDSGLLKLTKSYQWVLGHKVSAPINNKPLPKEFQNDSDQRKRLNILKYDAIKREMMLLTIVVGTICSGFCLVALSVQVAISYAAGVLLSCFYLQLLCYHVDNLSRESVPQVFMQKKSKKIGIRSEDVSNLLEKVVKGSAFALSSPRLMIPAAIYGFWGLSNHFSDNLLGFQLVPAMFGMFAYKAAALVQVYRDNEDLLIVFPESWEGSSN